MSVKRKGIGLMKKRWKKIMCGILMASSLAVPFYAQTADAMPQQEVAAARARSVWWHFTLENEPYPDTYFTFPVRQTGR